jgi:two-component system, NarL family, nitrate/nitrite response regulator NarL
MGQRVRVVLADAHDVFVEGLSMILAGEDDLEVVALAADGRAALEAVAAHEPDVLVAGTSLPGGVAAELVRAVGRSSHHTRVLLLAADGNGQPADLRHLRAHAWLSRASSGRELAAAIRALAEGRTTAAHGLGGQFPEADEHVELLLSSLSARERQILVMLARGWSNRRIAQECLLSLNTIRTHVQNVLVKLGVHSKLEAAALAVRHGLVPVDGDPALPPPRR